MILLAVLLVVTLGVYLISNVSNDVVVDKGLFKLEDFSTIDKVILSKSEEKIELTFDGARWKVNDQLADRSMIDVLFATLQQVEPKRLVAESLKDSIGLMLRNGGVHVQLFEGNNLQKEFMAGGNQRKTQAYFKNPTDDDSYVMVIPGYRVYASGIFELDENGWKDRYVFNFNWRNFKSLKALFPADSKNDFEVSMGESYFEVKDMVAVDTTKLNDFLDAISLLEVDQYIKPADVVGYDSLLKTNPQLEIEVNDISGKSYFLSIYDLQDQPQALGIIQTTNPAYIDKRKIKGLLKERAWFRKN